MKGFHYFMSTFSELIPIFIDCALWRGTFPEISQKASVEDNHGPLEEVWDQDLSPCFMRSEFQVG